MKKIFAILLSMLLVLSLAACSGGSEEATAESGYRFVCWSKGDEVISTEPFYTTVAREAMSLTANFEKQIPTSISAASAGNHSVNDAKYDLSGRKIEKITKPGVYIIGSKTVIVQ